MTTTAHEQPQVQDLNLIDIGYALVRIAMTSRLMGHSNLTCTVRDYLSPHSGERSPEQQFVSDVLTGGNPASEEEAVEWLQSVNMPPLDSRS